MQHIKNIILDYGNVIFSIDFALTQKAFVNLGIADDGEFYGHLKQDGVFDLFDRGDISSAEFRERIREVAGNPDLTDQQIDDAWNALLIGIEDGNHELLMQLKAKYRTFLLSNTNDIHYQEILKRLDANYGFKGNEHLFEKVYYSHLEGKRKPELAFFKQVLDENGLNPAETLFIDDSPQHLEGAKKAGIQTFLLTWPDTLQQFVKREGFL